VTEYSEDDGVTVCRLRRWRFLSHIFHTYSTAWCTICQILEASCFGRLCRVYWICCAFHLNV